MWQPANVNKASEGRIRGMLELRDEVRSLMEMEMSGDVEEEAVSRQREAARQSYADFVEQYGDLNERRNVAALAGDPDAHFLRGLEVFRDEKWQEADVFHRRAFSPAAEYTATSPSEAMDVSLNVKGRVDVDYIAQMLGQPKNQVVQQLASEGLVYLNPETRQFEPRSQYLSGTGSGKAGLCQGSRRAEPGLPTQHRGPGAGAAGAGAHRRRLPVHEQFLAAGRHDERGPGPRPCRRQQLPPGALLPRRPTREAGGLQPRDGDLGPGRGDGRAQVQPE